MSDERIDMAELSAWAFKRAAANAEALHASGPDGIRLPPFRHDGLPGPAESFGFDWYVGSHIEAFGDDNDGQRFAEGEDQPYVDFREQP